MALAIGKQPLYEAPKSAVETAGRSIIEGSEHAMQGAVGATREALGAVVNLGATAVDATVGEAVHATWRLGKDLTLGTVDAGKKVGSSLIGVVATPADRVIESVSSGWNTLKTGSAGDIPKGIWGMTGGAMIGGFLGTLSGSWNATKTTFGQTVARPIGSGVRQTFSLAGGVLGKTGSFFGQVLRAPISIGAPLVTGTLKAIGTPFSMIGNFLHRFNPMPPYTSPTMYGNSYQERDSHTYGSQGNGRAGIKKFAVPKK